MSVSSTRSRPGVLAGLAARTPVAAGVDGPVVLDVDDTIVPVHGYAKQGAGFGYTGVRGLNALIATVATAQAAPVIVAQRLRRGGCGSARGAARLVADAASGTPTATSATMTRRSPATSERCRSSARSATATAERKP
jgi:hypothetical protein